MLVTSGNDTYAILLYTGYGDDDATVGYNSSVTQTFFTLPDSQSCSIRHIASRSNVNIPGMFVFALDGTQPVSGIATQLMLPNVF